MPLEDGEGAVREVDGWIRAARGGDAAAMERVVAHLGGRLGPFVEQTLNGLPRRLAQAEDVLQHTLIGIAERLTRMPFTPTEPQLVSFARRAAQFRIADLRRELARWQGESALDAWSALAESGGTGEVTRADDAGHLRELVARLPERYAEAVRLCALEGLSFVAAAERLGERPDALRKRYTKALELLRAMLERGGGG